MAAGMEEMALHAAVAFGLADALNLVAKVLVAHDRPCAGTLCFL